ncbi:MAG: HD domain-containing protein [Paludibacteraceae bacterium]|nr:HD domain-containing protein [Paludibacteraceae bacterium]
MAGIEEKRILDSVHGYIRIEEEYIKNVIDTEYFQRLRRIEQTSTRALFPSARHDRFIHSLGVFHLGSKIVENLRKYYKSDEIGFNLDVIFNSYRAACLLHDIAHSPFSHTFEAYFDNNKSKLREILMSIVDSQDFRDDWENSSDRSAPHERMSAIVAIKIYREFLENVNHSDIELLARMIIGLYYRDTTNEEKSFRNAMIDLIHGDVIDADGLDYVCRDAWASGYSTTRVDVERLVSSIRIEKDNTGKYTLCFTSKALNEIESVLKVKTFQQYYVINHHTVTYEQKLLVESVKSAALSLIGCDDSLNREDLDTQKENAIRNLCSIYAFIKPNENTELGVYTKNKVRIALPMDDDFVFLLKEVRDDKYVKQWLSRQYELKPLWKSKAEFYALFPDLANAKLTKGSWIFHDECRDFISQEFNIPKEDIWIEKATPKYKGNFAKHVHLFVDSKVVKYDSLFPKDIQSFEPPFNEFFYIYVPKDKNIEEIIEKIQKELSKYIFDRL